LYNYDARLYDPVIGRFISPDSIVPAPFNPQSLNRYSYVLNNPLMYTDPSGQTMSVMSDQQMMGVFGPPNPIDFMGFNFSDNTYNGFNVPSGFTTNSYTNYGVTVNNDPPELNSLVGGFSFDIAGISIYDNPEPLVLSFTETSSYVNQLTELVSATSRALDFNTIRYLSNRAETNEGIDPFAHQKAAWDYGYHVGNATIAGIARTASEFVWQFPTYTALSVYSRVIKGEGGEYWPWTVSGPGGIADSLQDIQNTMDGANRIPCRSCN
jgi:hypothetical protein